MNGKAITVLLVLLFVAGITYLVVRNWDTISALWSGKGGGLKECKDLSAFECVKNYGAIKTTSTKAGDRYDYPNTSDGSYGFYANNRAVIIGTSPAKKGSYDKKQITWDDGDKTLMKDIFKS